MENIAEKLNLVIEYIENHLTDEIESDKIEKIACCSYYDVSRMFSLIADINISDYIRKRRLTLAGAELKRGNVKVIDVALKYGYDSPVSFARAFQAFHGFNPSSVNNSEAVLNVFPRLVWQISVKGVMDTMNIEKMLIDGKEYDSVFLGERDMSSWSSVYYKRKYWRLENAYNDFKDNPKLEHVLPYNNYPPINIETTQVFVIDYYKSDETVERKYYIADGSVWNEMPCTREIILDYLKPIRKDKINILGKEYDADYLGEQDMSFWSDFATKREFWRLENSDDILKKHEVCNDVLPYNNYPPIKIEIGHIFVIDYHTTKGVIDRRYYLADGTIWRDMPSTRQIIPINNEDSK